LIRPLRIDQRNKYTKEYKNLLYNFPEEYEIDYSAGKNNIRNNWA